MDVQEAEKLRQRKEQIQRGTAAISRAVQVRSGIDVQHDARLVIRLSDIGRTEDYKAFSDTAAVAYLYANRKRDEMPALLRAVLKARDEIAAGNGQPLFDEMPLDAVKEACLGDAINRSLWDALNGLSEQYNHIAEIGVSPKALPRDEAVRQVTTCRTQALAITGLMKDFMDDMAACVQKMIDETGVRSNRDPLRVAQNKLGNWKCDVTHLQSVLCGTKASGAARQQGRC